MSGYPNENAEAFKLYSDSLRLAGYRVYSPWEFTLTEGLQANRHNYMRRDLGVLLADGTPYSIDAIAVLPNWKLSRGSRCEVMVGRELGMPVVNALNLLSVDLDGRFTFMPREVFINGRFCVGKDYIADELVYRLGYTKLSFADALKQEVAEKSGVTVDEIKRNKGKWRTLLQKYGTEKRAEDPLYWINRWQEARNKIDGNVVCADVRFVNESEFSTGRSDAFTVQVRLDDAARLQRARNLYGEVTEDQVNHESELAADACKFNAVVPGTLPSEDIPYLVADRHVEWVAMGKPVFTTTSKLITACNGRVCGEVANLVV